MPAVIDIGSNTVQLIIGERAADGGTKVLLQTLRTTRLGLSDRPAHLAKERIEATLSALAEYRDICAAYGVTRIKPVATSAVRDAENRAEFTDAVQAAFGWQVEVLSGEEEARFSCAGALASAAAAGDSAQLIIDLGGSSTELIVFADSCIQSVQSMQLGAARAVARGWDRPAIAAQLQQQLQPVAAFSCAVGVGGTATTAIAWQLGLQQYDRARIDGGLLTLADIEAQIAKLEPLSRAERCAASPLLAQRGEVMLEGLYILAEVCRALHIDALRVSGGGIPDGVLQTLL